MDTSHNHLRNGCHRGAEGRFGAGQVIHFAAMLVLAGTISNASALRADVLATYEFHQLTRGGIIAEYPSILVGQTCHCVGVSADGVKFPIIAAPADGSPPRVTATWDASRTGLLLYFSFHNQPILASNNTIQVGSSVALTLDQPVISDLQGDLFSTGAFAYLKDTRTGIEPGVHRVRQGGFETVVSSRMLAARIGVPADSPLAVRWFSRSADGSKIVLIADFGSDNPAYFDRVGRWWFAVSGNSVAILNEGGKPYDSRMWMPRFTVSGGGQWMAWSAPRDDRQTVVTVSSFGSLAGTVVYSSQDRPNGFPTAPYRFFYFGERLAVLIGNTGYASLADGSGTFQLVANAPGTVFRNDAFNWPYTDEFNSGLVSFASINGSVTEAAVLRINPQADVRRNDAPAILKFSLKPGIISNGPNQRSIQMIQVASQHPVSTAAASLFKDGILSVDGMTAFELNDNGRKDPDETANDGWWSGHIFAYPQASGMRMIRYQVESRDSSERYHGYAVDVGSYKIDSQPPATDEGTIDVVSPDQRNDTLPGDVAGGSTGSGIAGSGSGSSGAGGTSGSSNAGGTGATGTGTAGAGSGSSGSGPPGPGTAGSAPTTGGSGGGGAGTSGTGPGTTRGTTSGGAPGASGPPASPGAASNGAGSPGGSGSGSRRTTIDVDRRVVEVGQTVAVPVYLRNPNGTANLNVEITYDPSVVTPANEMVRGNALPPGALFSANAAERGVIRLGFAGSASVPADGTVAELIFQAVGGAGQSTALSPTVIAMNDAGAQVITPEVIAGRIAIVNRREPGDFDGDGRLTAADALAALEMSVRLRPVDLVLDMNRDGSVSSLDASLILRAVVGRTP